MDTKQIVGILKTNIGSNKSARWSKPLKTRKGVTDKVRKVTNLVVRAGFAYDNMGVVKEGRENGSLPEENTGLPWGEWAEYPFHIQHKGTDYVRFYPASGMDVTTGKEFKPEVAYFLNDQPYTGSIDYLKTLCLASEFSTITYILTDTCDPDEAPKKFTLAEASEFVNAWNAEYGTSFKSPEDFNSPLYTLVQDKPLCWTIKAENVDFVG